MSTNTGNRTRSAKRNQKNTDRNRTAPGRGRAKRAVRKMSSGMRRKLTAIFVMVVIVLIGLLIRITYINATSGDKYTKQVLATSQSQYGSTTLPYKRGDILDRNGTVLATSEKKYNVIFDCKVCNSNEDFAAPTVEALESILGLDANAMMELLTNETTKNSQYQIVRRDISIEEKQAFDAYCDTSDESLTKEERTYKKNIRGVWFEEDYVRTYPFGSLACDLIGFTYDSSLADWGIEGYYNNMLSGVDGRRYGYWGSGSDIEQTIVEPVDGLTVQSTIDANIQAVVEKYVESFDETFKTGPYSTTSSAKNIGVVVMNPNDGSILAMASNNPYDLNNPRDLTKYYTEDEISKMTDSKKLEYLNELWKNYCISDTYEPGSVVKPMTLAAAINDGTITESDTFLCDGAEVVSGTTIKCEEEHYTLDLDHVIAFSCNDSVMQIAEKMGIEEFCKYQSLFNFGRKTGIDLSGEASGLIYTKDTIAEIDLATSSFGQGFTCTMIQEAAAFSAVINGGNYYQPRVVSRILDENGVTKKELGTVKVRQVISEDVSDTVKSYLKTAVEEGSGVFSKLDGYTMGGKTGTAQKIPRGNGKYIVSYVTFVPYDDPQVVVYVVIDEPNIPKQDDNRFPQWVARDILQEILPYMGIYEDEAPNPDYPYYVYDFTNLDPYGIGDMATADTGADTNVPEPQDDAGETEGGNTQQSEGYTNEEAALTSGEQN